MGVHNKITRTKYEAIKSELKTPQDDKKVIEKYKISQTTARYIRRSRDYRHYVVWSNPSKKKVRKVVVTDVRPIQRPDMPTLVTEKELQRVYLELRHRIDDIDRKEVKIATFKLIVVFGILLCLIAMSVGFIIERFGA